MKELSRVLTTFDDVGSGVIASSNSSNNNEDKIEKIDFELKKFQL